VLKGMKMFQCPKAVAEEHYEDLAKKPFFGDLVEYIVSGPVMCMVWEGPGAVKACRLMIGETNPLVSNPGTIRGDLAVEVGRNVIHGSDSVESAEREIALWFGGAGELVDWVPANTPWVREA
jgi:nucleoside-diphosphate kinase